MNQGGSKIHACFVDWSEIPRLWTVFSGQPPPKKKKQEQCFYHILNNWRNLHHWCLEPSVIYMDCKTQRTPRFVFFFLPALFFFSLSFFFSLLALFFPYLLSSFLTCSLLLSSFFLFYFYFDSCLFYIYIFFDDVPKRRTLHGSRISNIIDSNDTNATIQTKNVCAVQMTIETTKTNISLSSQNITYKW